MMRRCARINDEPTSHWAVRLLQGLVFHLAVPTGTGLTGAYLLWKLAGK